VRVHRAYLKHFEWACWFVWRATALSARPTQTFKIVHTTCPDAAHLEYKESEFATHTLVP
jgi:hypothetical protein